MLYLTYTVPSDLDGHPVRRILRGPLQMADGLISSLKFRPNGILLNDSPVRVTAAAHTGDVLRVLLDDDGTNPAAPLDAEPDIRWQDEHFAIVSKPAGTAVYGEPGPNLAGIFAAKWGLDHAFRPVNRLDVGTSGLLLIARSRYMHDRLRRLLHTDAFVREYLAVCAGVPEKRSDSITLPVSREENALGRHYITPDGLPSRTDYTVLYAGGDRALLRLRLYTGRTHQIRVHLAALGHPLLGDARYGTGSEEISRHALHSARVIVTHPLSGEVIDISDPLPPDMAGLLPHAFS